MLVFSQWTILQLKFFLVIQSGVLPHLIVVEVSRLPRDALIEWQVVGTTGMSHTVSETGSLYFMKNIFFI